MTPIPGSITTRSNYPAQAFFAMRTWRAEQQYNEINAYVFFEVNRLSTSLNLQF